MISKTIGLWVSSCLVFYATVLLVFERPPHELIYDYIRLKGGSGGGLRSGTGTGVGKEARSSSSSGGGGGGGEISSRKLSFSHYDAREIAVRKNQEEIVVACGNMKKKYGIEPIKTWGSAAIEVQANWDTLNCDKYAAIPPGTIYDPSMLVEVVSLNHKEYKKDAQAVLRASRERPQDGGGGGGVGGGKANPGVTASMREMESMGLKMASVSTSSHALLTVAAEDKAWCLYHRKKYSIIPQRSWGLLPPHLQIQWKEHGCDVVFSMSRRSEYKIVSCPLSNYKDSVAGKLPLIAIMAGSTTRKINKPSPKTMALFNYLLPSLRTSLDCGYRYVFVMGYDEGDPYHDSDEGMAVSKAWFQEHIQGILEQNGIHMTFLTVRVKNTIKKPGPIFIAMARKAYEAGADFFYRINDDTELVGRWPETFVKTIMALPPPYGVVGPFCNVNKKILTHDFVHRTHMEVFEMNYYPPLLTDWWMDDWVTVVYGLDRTFLSKSAEVIHHTGAHGQRYEVNRNNLGKLDVLAKSGRQAIRTWMLKNNRPESEIATFDRNTLPAYHGGGNQKAVIQYIH
jgi:hypothetical protein